MREKVIENFNEDKGYIKNNGFKIIDVNENECIMEYEVKKEGLNPIKIVHGGLLFGLADTTAGALACMTSKFPVTVNSNIQYLNAARCKKLIAKATVLKSGNHIGFYRVDIKDENDILICICNVEMYLK